MMKRPMLWILGVWILGELMAVRLGITLVPASGAELAMAGQESAMVQVCGCVRQIHRTSSGYSYLLTDNTVQIGGTRTDARDLLVYTQDVRDIHIGQIFMVTGILSPFLVPTNPGEFDLRSYYRAQGIEASLKESARHCVSRKTNRIGDALYRLREAFTEAIVQTAGEEEAAVMRAVLLGDRSALDAKTRDRYQLGGISHILAVSGLHVSLMGMAVFRMLRRRLPKAAAILISLAAAAAFIEMTGGSSSAVRAGLMFGLMLLSKLFGRSYDMLSGLSAAALFLLIQNPLLLWQPGFLLSVLAILSIGWLWPEVLRFLGWDEEGEDREKGRTSRRRQAAETALVHALGPSCTLQIMILPVLASMNGVIPLMAPLANLIVLPTAASLLGSSAVSGGLEVIATVCSWAGASPAAGILGSLGRLCAFPARGILFLYRIMAEYAVRLPGYLWVSGAPGKWQILCYYLILAGAAAWMHFGKWRSHGKIRRVFLLTAVSAGLLLCLRRQDPGDALQITVLDVGQGSCVFIRDEEHAFLIDAGSSSSEDVGIRRILPFLRHQGVRHLDALILTHADSDHYSGMEELLQDPALSVGCLAMTACSAEDEELNFLRRDAEMSGVSVRVLEEGDRWKAGKSRFRCCYPDAEEQERFAKVDKNETSLVIRLEREGFSAVFPGDLGEEGERCLLEREGAGQADLLVVGHHGSRGSSSEAFLHKVLPRYAVISCQKNNRYGHPHRETLERLSDVGAIVLGTYEKGAVTFLQKKEKLIVYGMLGNP